MYRWDGINYSETLSVSMYQYANTCYALAQLKFRIWAIWLNIRKHMLSVIKFTNIGKLTDPRNWFSGAKFLVALARNSVQKTACFVVFPVSQKVQYLIYCIFG